MPPNRPRHHRGHQSGGKTKRPGLAPAIVQACQGGTPYGQETNPNQAWTWMLAVHSFKRKMLAKEGEGLGWGYKKQARGELGEEYIWSVNVRIRKNKGFVQTHPWCGHCI